jgi:Toprim domain
VEIYLGARGLRLPPAPVLRWLPYCWNRETQSGLPAMLGRVDNPDGEFAAVHRTWLKGDGSGKAPLRDPKKSWGPVRGGAVRLAPAAPLLAIAEGIENALTAIAAGYAAWSAVAVGGFQSVVLPPIVETVLIVADHNANGVGQRAALKAAERWFAEGRRVRLWLAQRAGDDLNDLIRGRGVVVSKEHNKGNGAAAVRQTLDNDAVDLRPPLQPKPKPNGGRTGLTTARYDLIAGAVADLALMKVADQLAFTLKLPEVMQSTGLGRREIERLIKPLYDRLVAQKAAAIGEDAAPGQRDEVEKIGEACELFCDADGIAFAGIERAGHRETWPVSSSGFRRYVLGEYRRRYGRLAGGTALAEGIGGIEARACEGRAREVFVRLGAAGEKIYLDLCREDWKVVEIDGDGWRILDASPVPFLRPTGRRPLPLPCRDEHGDECGIGRLRALVNIPDQADWILYVSWLVGCFWLHGTYAILMVNGEQGSAKTWVIKTARRLIDPATVLVAKPPASEEDLIIAAKNARVVAYDNLSSIDDDLADQLCRLASGAGLETRKLYTVDEQSLIAVRRPIAFNGIPDVVSRGDLADRVISLLLPRIADDSRQREEDLDEEFIKAAPMILGGLLDGVVAGLKGRAAAAAAMKKTPRLADFAAFAAAAASAFNWTAEEFLEAYEANRQTRVEHVVEADPVAEVIYRLVFPVDDKAPKLTLNLTGLWEGSATDLLEELDKAVSEGRRRQKKWPKSASALSNRLRRIAPALRRLGIEVDKYKSGERKIFIAETPSAPSKP